MIKYKYQKGQRVMVKTDHGLQVGYIVKVCPHPFAPSWIIHPKYFIKLNYNGDTCIYRQRQIIKV
jgi:hypothetical protein